MKFFISYTTKDKEITVDFLKTVSFVFQEIGQVFIDIIHNDSIDKQSRVFLELEASDILVLINSQNINNSNWVAKELNRAQQLGIPTINLLPCEINSLTIDILLNRISNPIIAQS